MPHVHFVGGQRNHDTIVFIHGILYGHYKNTWTRFSKLLPGDPDLPRFDLMLWGYDTGYFKGRSIDLNGERLITEMRQRINTSENQIVLVGHSLGGLVLLKALCTQMERALANEVPCSQVSQIITFGTPLNGHWVARIAKKFLPFSRFLNHQVRDLCQEDSCKPLVENIKSRIYEPVQDNETSRKIPIRLNIGNRDKVVTERDRSAARAIFTNPPPNEYDGTHSDLKDPKNRTDHRYLVLQSDLQETGTRTFDRLSSEYLLAASDLEKAGAMAVLEDKFGHMVKVRMRKYHAAGDKQKFLEQALYFAAQNSLRRRQHPFRHIDHAVRALIKLQQA